MMDNLNDIGGIRVICPFIQDIYTVADMLMRQSDLTLIEKKDYISSPKPNGYRSLHLILEVPIFLSERTVRCASSFSCVRSRWISGRASSISCGTNLT